MANSENTPLPNPPPQAGEGEGPRLTSTPHATQTPGTLSVLRRLPRLAGRALILVYRYTLSPLIGPRCRHMPSCSEYGEEALNRHGLWAGGWMTLGRICRCQPYGTSGLDFVCDEVPARARWYLPWRYARWRGVNLTPPQKSIGQG